MSTVVAVMDRGSWQANTDNIVVVEPVDKSLLWVPRDLWCACVGDRINRAFRLGGPDLLRAALAEHGIEAGEVLCLRRDATERALRDATIVVPVPERMVFWYQMAPQLPIEDGRRLIVFEPPRERLQGERIHQWLQARYRAPDDALPRGTTRPTPWQRLQAFEARVSRAARRLAGRRAFPPGALPDLDRIERQKTLLRSLLHEGFDFTIALQNPEWISLSSESALDELRSVRVSWRFRTFDRVEPRTIDGKQVLVNVDLQAKGRTA